MKTISRYIMTLALLITAVSGAWAADTYTITFSGFGNEARNKTVTDAALEYSETFTMADVDGNYMSLIDLGGSNEYVSISQGQYDTQITITVKSAFEGTEIVTVYYVNGDGDEAGRNISVTCVKNAPAIEVTTNAASKQDLFTEAKFTMPPFDATAEYELVRDLGYKVAFSGVPTRARLAKDGDGKFHFADPLTFQLLDNIDATNPKDITSAEGITFMVGEVEAVDIEGSTFYQLNKETLVPLADFLADAHLGNYAICAVASTGEYDGSFTSGTITLFQGYEVEVAAKEFITYYKDEPLYVEDEAAELYTITEVTATEAVLSSKINVVAAGTPMLIFNNSEQDKTFLLIPTTEQADAVTAADQFKGTLEEKNMPASTEGEDYYVCTGNAFVWVKSAGTIAANRCWLEIIAQPNGVRANTRSIVSGGDTTNIDATTRDALEGDYYDLQGRKVEKPLRKGVYIKSGKKVIKH